MKRKWIWCKYCKWFKRVLKRATFKPDYANIVKIEHRCCDCGWIHHEDYVVLGGVVNESDAPHHK